MNRLLAQALLATSPFYLSSCGNNGDSDYFSLAADYPVPDFASSVLSGGDTSDPNASRGSSHAFSVPASNLTEAELVLHLDGDADFEQSFITAPSAEKPDFDGAGPVNNNTNCNACHQRDGRGTPPGGGISTQKMGSVESLFLRISIESDETRSCIPSAGNDYCAPLAVPNFSTQLFHRGQALVRPDSPGTGQADVYVSYEYSEIEYLDGEIQSMRKPVFDIRNPYDSPGESLSTFDTPASRLLQADVKTSPRLGMPVFGLGLLEAIDEADILALADEADSNNDGISGKPNRVYDPAKRLAGDPNPVSLGRFGWKANTPSVMVQSLGALRGDIGITNFLFPQESIEGTDLHNDYLTRNPLDTGRDEDGNPEASEAFSLAVTFYAQTLHVPARRDTEAPETIRGATLFEAAGCTACHQPTFVTGTHPDGIAALSGQTIHPFTDMLLHDMGEGLADGRQDFQADGREWKTRPLWGIGLTKVVNPQAGFLHDGRAQSLEEAILWHGGEAETAKENFRTMKKSDRAALIRFLDSL
ncbi:MAG: c-type cytochrome [Gammaproteobacteria bacterium]|nr:c-type cytochrome [Gammaproteobacteria bacterium]